MTFDLRVDVVSWREHLATVLAEHPGLVPVAKGNGYGFGIDLLGAETGRLGLGALAVGTRYEVAAARTEYAGDLLVLTPWDHRIDPLPASGDPTIRTVSSVEALHALQASGAAARVVAPDAWSACSASTDDTVRIVGSPDSGSGSMRWSQGVSTRTSPV